MRLRRQPCLAFRMKTLQDTNPLTVCRVKTRFVLAVVLFFLTAGGIGHARGPEKLFEQLKEGQSARVEFSSKGCFHNETYEFEFRRVPALAATITRVEMKWDAAKKEYVETGRVALGTVDVSDDEAAGLDRALQFYRRPRADTHCTTSTCVSVMLRDGEKVISEEHLRENTCSIQNIAGLVLFSDLTDKLLGNPKRVAPRQTETKAERDMALTMAVCRKIAGYERLVNSFEVNDTMVHYTDGKPFALMVRVEALRPDIVDAAWCTIWLENGEPSPSLNWENLMKTFSDAENAMSAHPWLRNWKSLEKQGLRSLELWLQGKQFDADFDSLGTYAAPLWRHEGFSGQPAYCCKLYRRGGISEVYFGDIRDTEKRALMTMNMPDQNSPSMIERADVHWHPNGKAGERYSRYAIIENDGNCRVETFVARETGETK